VHSNGSKFSGFQSLYIPFNKIVLFLIYQPGGRILNLILVKTHPKNSNFEQMVTTCGGYDGVGKNEVNISVLFFTKMQNNIIMHSLELLRKASQQVGN